MKQSSKFILIQDNTQIGEYRSRNDALHHARLAASAKCPVKVWRIHWEGNTEISDLYAVYPDAVTTAERSVMIEDD